MNPTGKGSTYWHPPGDCVSSQAVSAVVELIVTFQSMHWFWSRHVLRPLPLTKGAAVGALVGAVGAVGAEEAVGADVGGRVVGADDIGALPASAKRIESATAIVPSANSAWRLICARKDQTGNNVMSGFVDAHEQHDV